MTSTSYQHESFTTGEISPALQSRYRLQQYTNSAKSLKNCFVRPQGGAVKRPGTIFAAEIKNSANVTRLIPFEYSNTDAYVLEFGAGYIRFFRNGGAVLSAAAISNGTFATDLTGWTDDDTGTGASTQTSGVMRLNGGASGVAARTQAVSYVGTSQYTLSFTVATNTCTYKIGTTLGGTDIATGTSSIGANSVNFTPTSSGTVYIQFSNSANSNSDIDSVSLNTPVYEINTPYSQADIEEVQYAQSYDFIFLVHPNYAPRQITRSGHAQWTFSQIVFTDGPYFSIDDDNYGGSGSGITLTPSALTGSGVTMTSSASLFVSTDIGRIIRWRSVNSVAWGYCIITGYTNSTTVTVTVNKDLVAATSASSQWRLGEWSGTTGYPGVVTFYEQRMVFARSTRRPQTLWFSVSGDIFNFQPDDSAYKDAVVATSSMTYTIADTKANIITGLAAQKNLYALSGTNAWLASSSSQGEALTPDTIKFTAVIAEGSDDVQPLVSRTAVLYPNRFGRKILEIGYNLADDSYRTADLALLADHLTQGTIRWLAQQVAPNYNIWVVKSDGSLASITYLREQNVVAWSHHELGGTDVKVKSVAVIPAGTEDQAWFIVSRTINGATRQYIEYLSELFIDQDLSEAKFLDCSIPYSGGSTTVLTGLSHLEGETVQCFDGEAVVVVNSDVSSGAVTVAESLTTAVVGLPYSMEVSPSPLAGFKTPGGTPVGKRGRVDSVVLDVYRSYGGFVGGDIDHTDLIPELSSNTTMDSSLELVTGQVEIQVPSDFSLSPSIYIKHDMPLPFYLTGIVYSLSISSK